MPRSSSKLWPPRRAPRNVRSPMSHLLVCVPRWLRRSLPEPGGPAVEDNEPGSHSIPGCAVRWRRSCRQRDVTQATSSYASSGGPSGARRRPPSRLDRGGDLVAGLLDAAPRVEPVQEHGAEDEEDHERHDGGPVGPGHLEDEAEQEGAEPRRAPLAGVVEGEVLALP